MPKVGQSNGVIVVLRVGTSNAVVSSLPVGQDFFAKEGSTDAYQWGQPSTDTIRSLQRLCRCVSNHLAAFLFWQLFA